MDRTTRILSKQLQMLNQHLAKSRSTLESLLAEDKPVIELRNGSQHYFKKQELEKIADILPVEEHRRLRLPIYIELSSAKYGSGTARIAGRTESRVVGALLGKAAEEELFVYRPELRVLRKKLPTTTQYMFTLSIEK